MHSLEVYLESFEEYLVQNPFRGEPSSLFDAANYMMQLGGKRLRPAMVLMACDAFNNSFEDALPAAMAIEVFHNFTLVHDDLMDAAPLRRNKITVHKKWDMPTAILSGDLMTFAASDYLRKIPEALLNDALIMFNTTAMEVCRGQQMDMLFESRNDVTIDEYLDMIALKTSVLLGCSFYLGAIIGGARKEDASALYQFGKNLGIAFQLHDDILDAFAEDPASFGKQVGGDILSNKKTYLLISALKNATIDELEKLHYLLSTDDLNADQKVNAVKKLFITTNSKKETEAEQQRFYDKAIESLNTLPISEATKSNLKEFAGFVMKRKK